LTGDDFFFLWPLATSITEAALFFSSSAYLPREKLASPLRARLVIHKSQRAHCGEAEEYRQRLIYSA